MKTETKEPDYENLLFTITQDAIHLSLESRIVVIPKASKKYENLFELIKVNKYKEAWLVANDYPDVEAMLKDIEQMKLGVRVAIP